MKIEYSNNGMPLPFIDGSEDILEAFFIMQLCS
jgi:hypothetical protein